MASPCAGSNTANAIAALYGEGVAVFAASGNDGFDDGISFPACVAQAISVGGVYDAALGPAGTEFRTPEGIRNLCSNVAEWTAEFTPLEGHGRKGPYAVGASYRDQSCYFYRGSPKPPEDRRPFLGFRCALDLAQVEELMSRPDPPLRIQGAEGGK